MNSVISMISLCFEIICDSWLTVTYWLLQNIYSSNAKERAQVVQWARKLAYLTTHTNLSPIRRGLIRARLFSFDHYIVCPSLIYALFLWYLQTFLMTKLNIFVNKLTNINKNYLSTSLTAPFLIEMPVPIQKTDWSCVLGVSVFWLFLRFWKCSGYVVFYASLIISLNTKNLFAAKMDRGERRK